METLIDYLDIDSRSRRIARQIWPLIEPRMGGLIDSFYADVSRFTPSSQPNTRAIEHLKTSQRSRWQSLFESRFDEDYFRSASLIGIRHYEMGLDSKWHVLGYAKMKNELSDTVIDAHLPLASKAQTVATLDKYLALDMAISLSSYTSILIE